MATDIILRSIKAAPLTHAEMDQNLESLSQTVDSVLASYQVLVADQNNLLEANISSGTITMPAVATASATDTDSFKVIVKNIHASSLTITGSGVETIDGATSITLLMDECITLSLSSNAAEWTATAFHGTYLKGLTSSAQSQLDSKQPLDADLTNIASLANTVNNFIVGTGSAWVEESGATARTSMGVDPAGTDNSTNVSLAGTPNYITIAGQVITRALINLTSHITGVLPLESGGTNSPTASGARTTLGVDAAGTDNSVTAGKTLTSTDDKIDNFPAATSMLYRQSGSPTGWTKITSNNDKALRLVSGTAISGGTQPFSSTFGSGKITDPHTLLTSEMPSHSHTTAANSNGLGGSNSFQLGTSNAAAFASNATGGDGGHTHNLSNFDLQYVDVIEASKD